MKVGLLGDVHGALNWTQHAIDCLYWQGVETIVQAGDFGIWYGKDGKAFLDGVDAKLKNSGMVMYVVPGNHENYNMIDDPEGTRREDLSFQQLRDTIFVVPRGMIFELGGMTFMGFGGAASIDRHLRVEEVDWWSAEMFRESDFDRLDGVEKGDVDVLVTHEATSNGTPAVQSILNTPEHARYAQWDYEYAAQSTAFMDRVVEKVQPAMHVHGHMHVADTIFDADAGITYISLDMNGKRGNAVVLDTENGGVTFNVIV